jgi:hypothetical protein
VGVSPIACDEPSELASWQACVIAFAMGLGLAIAWLFASA